MISGVLLYALMLLPVVILPVIAFGSVSKSSAFREDERQFPARDARGEVR